MGLLNLFGGGKSRHILVALEWEQLQFADIDWAFLKGYKGATLVACYKAIAKNERWAKLKEKGQVIGAQLPSNEPDLNTYLLNQALHAFYRGGYGNLVFITARRSFSTTVNFLKSKGFQANEQVVELKRRDNREGREGRDRDRSERSERGDRSERSERGDRSERSERGDRMERSGRSRPEREPRMEREARPEREPRPEREHRMEREARPEREPRPERVATEEPRERVRGTVEDARALVAALREQCQVGELYKKNHFSQLAKETTGKTVHQLFSTRNGRFLSGMMLKLGYLETVDDLHFKLVALPDEAPFVQVMEDRLAGRKPSFLDADGGEADGEGMEESTGGETSLAPAIPRPVAEGSAPVAPPAGKVPFVPRDKIAERLGEAELYRNTYVEPQLTQMHAVSEAPAEEPAPAAETSSNGAQ